jgi:hypothetical protein
MSTRLLHFDTQLRLMEPQLAHEAQQVDHLPAGDPRRAPIEAKKKLYADVQSAINTIVPRATKFFEAQTIRPNRNFNGEEWREIVGLQWDMSNLERIMGELQRAVPVGVE